MRTRALDPETRRQHALDLAWRQLNRRERTVWELRTFLEQRRVEPETIEQTIEELRGQGYLDDASFAERYAEEKRRLEGWGADRVERRLASRGVARELIEQALAVEDPEAEARAAREVLSHRFPEPPVAPRDQRRAFGVLVRKGYEPALASTLVRAYARETPPAGEL